ncbi:hypothetical protein BDV98DRAFT_571479 [Pterulicium gracile]|uniref:Uncharacterized protein n=1 Tax=Pterulicium gracile TaxID=1884261 RepID=A0A5C3QBB8_9AGAR|nr:hypothetical protein BDV98DRAFT_571479 [Pterula gracilis]
MTRRSFILPRTFAGQSEIQLVLKYTQNQHQSNSTYLANETPPSSPASTSDDDDDKDDDPESDYGDELTMASSELGADMPGELLSEQLKAICEATEGATDPALIALHRKCQVDNVLSALVGARRIPENGTIIEDLKLCFLWTCDRIIASVACSPAVCRDIRAQTFLEHICMYALHARCSADI